MARQTRNSSQQKTGKLTFGTSSTISADGYIFGYPRNTPNCCFSLQNLSETYLNARSWLPRSRVRERPWAPGRFGPGRDDRVPEAPRGSRSAPRFPDPPPGPQRLRGWQSAHPAQPSPQGGACSPRRRCAESRGKSEVRSTHFIRRVKCNLKICFLENH